MAANIENKKATTMDMTGLAQKGGAVWAYIKIYDKQKKPYSHKITPGMSDLLIACDQVVATKDEIQEVISKKRTYAIINSNSAPTSDFVSNSEINFKANEIKDLIKNSTRKILAELDSTRLSYKFFGNSINGNMIMLGASFQCGLIPLDQNSIIQAIKLNKIGAEDNLKAFNLGRLYIHEPNNEIFKSPIKKELISIKALREMIKEYSNKFFDDFIKIEKKLNAKKLNNTLIKHTLREYGRICLIKDEYAIAKMHLMNFKKIASNHFSSWSNVSFYLSPPLFSAIKDSKTQKAKKFKIPGFIAIPIFIVLNKLTFLRGSFIDIFKYTSERKINLKHKEVFEKELEKALINNRAEEKIDNLNKLSMNVKGYGHVREAKFNKFLKDLKIEKIKSFSV